MSLDDEILINSDGDIESEFTKFKRHVKSTIKLFESFGLVKSKILMNKSDYDDIVKWGNDGYA